MSWKTAKLGELCTIEKGATGILKAIPGEYPLVVTGEERKSHNEYQFDGEAVIIPLVSGTGHGHASIKRIHFQTGKFAVGSILCAVIPKNKNVLNAEYLFRFLDLNKEKELVARMKGMANVTLPLKEIAQIEIPLPSLNEQIGFVEYYKAIESDTENLNREFTFQLRYVKRLRQQLLQDAAQGKLVPQDENDEPAHDLLKKIEAAKAKENKKKKELPSIKPQEIPFRIPENWVWCRLGHICDKIGSGSTPKGSDYSKMGVPFFRSQNVYNTGLEYSDIKFISGDVHEKMKGTAVYPGDLLLNITGGSLGRCALVPNSFEGEGNVSQHVCIIRPLIVDAHFYHRIVLSPFFQNLIFSSTTGAGREGLPKYNLELFCVPLPPITEQRRIVARLDELIQTCDELEASIHACKEQNEQLLQQVLRETLTKNTSAREKKSLNISENRKAFAKLVLAGKIISTFVDDPNFTHVKFQKLQYLAEHVAEAELNWNYYRQAAGPYDPSFMHTVHIKLKASKWFEEKGYRYQPLEKAAQIEGYYKGFFAGVDDKLTKLFSYLSKATEAQAEIVATLYAVWNNFIIKKEEFTDEDIVATFFEWSCRKKNYTQEQVIKGLAWMREKEIFPVGWGKLIKEKKETKKPVARQFVQRK